MAGHVSNRIRISAALACLVAGAAGPLSAADSHSVAWQSDARTAWQQMLDQKRPLLLVVKKHACPYCDRLLEQSFADPEVARAVGGSFVPLALEAGENESWLEHFGVRMYPTTFLISPEGKILERLEGFKSSSELRQRLSQVGVERQASAQPAP